jgi:hypothetical protein
MILFYHKIDLSYVKSSLAISNMSADDGDQEDLRNVGFKSTLTR